jgi:hypothetical protein
MSLRHRNRREKLRDRLDIVLYATDGLPRIFTVYLQPADSAYLEDCTEYKYNFRPTRSQNDPVLRQIRNLIIKLNRHPEHHILMCNHNIKVFPSTESAPLWPLTSNNDNNVKFYTFCQDFQEFPATVPVSLISHKDSLNDVSIQVRMGGKWVVWSEWLVQLADDSILDKRSISPVTYLWNKRVGNKFRLMALPVELRHMIFEHVIAPTDEMYPLRQIFHDEWRIDVTQLQREQSHITLGIGYQNDDILNGKLSCMM